MAECSPAFRYLIFFIVYIIAFSCLFNLNLELLGFGLLFSINLVTSFFISADLMGMSGSKYDVGLLVLYSSLGLNIVAMFLVLLTLIRLHKQFVNNGKSIQLSPQNREILTNFEIILTTNLMLMLSLCTLFFLGKPGVPFFSVAFGQNTAIREFFFLIVKVVFSAGTMGLSGYLIYMANAFMKIIGKQLDT